MSVNYEWFKPIPPYTQAGQGWDQSVNNGGAYTPGVSIPAGQVVGGIGQVRYRHQFTIPADIGGTFTVRVTGDIQGGNGPAQVFYDGILQGPAPGSPTVSTFVLPVVPGPHTFELRMGSNTAVGITAPIITVDYDLTAEVPCECCGLGSNPVCYQSDVEWLVPNNVTVFANPNGVTVSLPNLLSTIDSDTRTPQAVNQITVASGAANQPTNLVLEYAYAIPRDLVFMLGFWNNDINANGAGTGNGIASATVTVLDPNDVVLFTGPLTLAAPIASNQIGQTNFPSSLRNVSKVRLSNITKQVATQTAIRWREVNLWGYNTRRALMCACPDIRFFDTDNGVEADQPSLVSPCVIGNPCDPNAPLANSVGWTVYNVEGGVTSTQGVYAEKIVNGVTITCRVIARDSVAHHLNSGVTSGDSDPNALTNVLVAPVNGSFITLEFDSSVAQNHSIVRLIDLDQGGEERVQFDLVRRTNADLNVPILTGLNGVRWLPGPLTWDSNDVDNASSELSWFNIPWGGGNPLVVTFSRLVGTAGQSGSQFDFGGPIQSFECI